MTDFTTIDFHNHIRPKPFLEAVKEERAKPASQKEAVPGAAKFQERLFTSRDVPHLKIENTEADALRNLRDSKTDLVVLSLPNASDFGPQSAVKMCKLVNDEWRRIKKENPGKFAALASLPQNSIQDAIIELDRSVNDLELDGVTLRTNMDGAVIDDQRFRPLLEKINDYELAVLLHPGLPPWGNIAMVEYNLTSLIGFQFDTVVAATRLMFSGTLDDFPKIKFVLAHLGAGITFLVHRITAQFHEGAADVGIKAKKQPLDYVKQQFYFDTATGDVPTTRFALQCVYDSAGPERILFGTDYPWHGSDEIRSLRQSIIDSKNYSDSDKKNMLGENAKRILRLN